MIKKHKALKYFVILGIMASKSFAQHFDKKHEMIQNIDLGKPSKKIKSIN